ncbi:MAG: glycosyl hydrolase family 32 domain protein [Armatimonadia bacterium]|nr:glycosyl hydrolase family 32 domain protein [Armatimonadia bacterium]
MDKGPDRTSLVPKFAFAETLEAQEAQLEDNPLMLRFAQSRRAFADDRYRPLYHFVSPEHTLNDPNGLCFWQGRWHLFYQGYPPEDPRQHWGHAVSDDLIHWRDLPYAIYPNPENACYSGSTLVEEDRVIAMYHGTEVGNMVAVSDDPLLLNWEKVTGEAVIPLRQPFNVFDPCIWKHDGTYYSLSAGTLPGPGGKPVRAEFLLRSEDLASWEYLHPFLEDDQYSLVGDDGACPYFWPIGDKHILLHFSHMSGGKYILGEYDTERQKLVVQSGGNFNFGPAWPAGVHAPSATPDGEGGVIVIFNMNAAKPTPGWNQIMSLPRHLWLEGQDTLRQAPAGDIQSLRKSHTAIGETELPANQEVVLEGVEGNAMEIIAEIDVGDSPMVEMRVLRSPGNEEYTRIAFYPNRGFHGQSLVSLDTSYSSSLHDVRSRAPETGPLSIPPGELLRLRVFVDRSVVEVFVNERQCVAARVYPGREDSLGVSFRSQGTASTLKSVDAWQMDSIYEAHAGQ